MTHGSVRMAEISAIDGPQGPRSTDRYSEREPSTDGAATRGLERLGGAFSVFQGLGLFSLTIFFGVLFPHAGVAGPADFTDPARYLPAVTLHPLWFVVPAFVHGLLADTLFIVTLWALWRRL